MNIPEANYFCTLNPQPNMKRIFSILFLISLLMITVFSACKKNNDTKPPLTLLTQSPWKPFFYGYDNNNDGILADDMSENIFAEMECVLDDSYAFDKNGTFMIHVNENTDCGGTIDGGPYPWKLESDGIHFNYDGQECIIEILDEHNLRLYTLIDGEKLYYVYKRE